MVVRSFHTILGFKQETSLKSSDYRRYFSTVQMKYFRFDLSDVLFLDCAYCSSFRTLSKFLETGWLRISKVEKYMTPQPMADEEYTSLMV